MFVDITPADKRVGRDLAVSALTAMLDTVDPGDLVAQVLHWADGDPAVTREALLWAVMTCAGAWNVMRLNPTTSPEDILQGLVVADL